MPCQPHLQAEEGARQGQRLPRRVKAAPGDLPAAGQQNRDEVSLSGQETSIMPATSSLQRRLSSLPRQRPAGPAGAVRKDPSEERTISRAHHAAAHSPVGLAPWPPHPTSRLPASGPTDSLQGRLETWGGLLHPRSAHSLLFPAAPQAFLTHNPMSFLIPSNIPFLMHAHNHFFSSRSLSWFQEEET